MSRDDRRLTAALAAASPDLLAYLQRRVGLDDAPDLLGETMVVAWRRMDDLPVEPERARMWLFGIARGTLLNHARGTRRRWALADRIRGDLATDAVAPGADDGAEVRDAIARMDPDLAELVRLVHWERLSLAEAAEVLAIPASTARGRYARAKEELRAVLGAPASLA
ncbi:RNA polymerase sigma factor [Microbacterium terricola]|uniref:DNA-directed RNA polymerase sigma-70 factor n=1 Tax=Microbacterium terricola TaxID=344163 RepID=A0ABM8DZ26_9MICO|nr:sigma-70 family RNA polymerase sigma factor [Microbacterium terricola]UYK41362.1 sigma-70 family RNA polymerase sigma factor [Microbacterium terricola]BDV30854.1 DNA-directed RNA polymerase sigma-70 factor [Microbacterium terricola]